MEITNIKCSVKIAHPVSLKVLEERCVKFKNWKCSKFGSYMVIKLPGSLRFIIFKPKNESSLSHINLTGVKSYKCLDKALELLAEYLECCRQSVDYRIDNITAKSSALLRIVQEHALRKRINLCLLMGSLETFYEKELNLRLNPDSFGALILQTYGKTTVLIYESGKIVVIGSKSEEDIISTLEKICIAGKDVLSA